jgi:hypothetical protein
MFGQSLQFKTSCFVALVISALSLMLVSCNNNTAVAQVSITSGKPPDGTLGKPYDFALAATGGDGDICWTWSAATGSMLPPGLTVMNDVLSPPPSGQGPVGCQSSIGGTPSAAGTYKVVLTASDKESPPQHASAKYTITIAP